jgi:predicted GIY-YIG superfamily endonuclease
MRALFSPAQDVRAAQRMRTSCLSPKLLHGICAVVAGAQNASASCMEGIGQRFVYILRSERDPSRHYVGRTANVDERLHWHNTGPSGVTRDHRPWSLLVSLEFADAGAAGRFERYLKTGSGRAFAKRHF